MNESDINGKSIGLFADMLIFIIVLYTMMTVLVPQYEREGTDPGTIRINGFLLGVVFAVYILRKALLYTANYAHTKAWQFCNDNLVLIAINWTLYTGIRNAI